MCPATFTFSFPAPSLPFPPSPRPHFLCVSSSSPLLPPRGHASWRQWWSAGFSERFGGFLQHALPPAVLQQHPAQTTQPGPQSQLLSQPHHSPGYIHMHVHACTQRTRVWCVWGCTVGMGIARKLNSFVSDFVFLIASVNDCYCILTSTWPVVKQWDNFSRTVMTKQLLCLYLS